MLLHVSHAAQHGHHQMLICTVDTGVVVLAVFAIHHLTTECELRLAFGTGKSFRYMAAHQIVVSLGPEMSCALPMFHGLTGYDTVWSFAGQKTAWPTWKSMPERTDGLLMLADGPMDVPDDARWTMQEGSSFHKTNSTQQIPPIRDVLEEHVKRPVYKGGHIWGKTCCHHQLTGSG